MDKNSSSPTKGSKRERTRAALIEAALQVVEEKGFVAATLDDIAVRAEMTKGAIYSNFGGKTDLMLAAVRSRAMAFAPAYEPGASLKVHLQQVAHAVAAMLPAMQKAARLNADFQVFLLGEPELRAKIAQETTQELSRLIDLLAARHGGELRVPPKQFVMIAQAMSVGFAHQSMQTPELIDEATILAAFETLASGATR